MIGTEANRSASVVKLLCDTRDPHSSYVCLCGPPRKDYDEALSNRCLTHPAPMVAGRGGTELGWPRKSKGMRRPQVSAQEHRRNPAMTCHDNTSHRLQHIDGFPDRRLPMTEDALRKGAFGSAREQPARRHRTREAESPRRQASVQESTRRGTRARRVRRREVACMLRMAGKPSPRLPIGPHNNERASKLSIETMGFAGEVEQSMNILD